MNEPISQAQGVPRVLAVDPGRSKCGVAVLQGIDAIAYREVIPREEFSERFRDLYDRYRPQTVVMGDSTGSGEVAEILARVPRVS